MSLVSDPPDAATRLVVAAAASRSAEARLVLVEWAAVSGAGRPAAAGGEAPPVCSWARTEAEPAIRSRAGAVCALQGLADESLLMSLAHDPEWQVRARLAAALASRRGEAGATAVLNLLAHDPHPTVRSAAMSRGPATS